MIRSRIHEIAITSLLLLATSCTKKGNTGATGPAGPAYTGCINGHVSLYDQYGSKVISGYENIVITLRNGTTTTPDNNGYYQFDSVHTGTYNITASGSSYAATLLTDVTFINDTLYRDVKLSAQPAFNLTSFAAMHNTGSAYDSLIITYPIDTKVRNCIIFVSNNANVSSNPANYLLSYIKSLPANATQATMRIPVSDLNNVNIFYGDAVYYAAYSYVVNDVSLYEDIKTGNTVYTAIGSILADSTMSP